MCIDVGQEVENDIPLVGSHEVDLDHVIGGCGHGHSSSVLIDVLCRSPHRRHSDSYKSRREEKPSQPIVTNVSDLYFIVGLSYQQNDLHRYMRAG